MPVLDRTSSRDEKAQGKVKIHGPPYAKIAKSLIQGQQSISQGPSEYVCVCVGSPYLEKEQNSVFLFKGFGSRC